MRMRPGQQPMEERATGESRSTVTDPILGDLTTTRLFPLEATIPVPDVELQNMVGPPGVFFDVALTSMGRLNMAGLARDHDVLDIGCGVGRIARFLCDYLDPSARYEGFDVMPVLIDWCRQNITPRFSNFHFSLAEVYNSRYNPDAALPSAAELRFPYPDDSFDFAFAHSVFTHLLPSGAWNYLHEVDRVLRPGGISYSTWFLFDESPAASVSPLIASMQLDPGGEFAVTDATVPESAIAYRESVVRRRFREAHLDIVEPVHPGFLKMQDVIVARRTP